MKIDEFNKIKKCVACGLLTAVVITEWGVFCKECLHEMHKHPHLAHGGMSYDWPINDYNPGIETTITAVTNSGTVTNFSDFYIL